MSASNIVELYSNISDCLNSVLIKQSYNISCVIDLNLFNGTHIRNVTTARENQNQSDEYRPFVPDMWVQIIWSTLFVTMVLGAVLGNLLVIWIILGHKKMRTKTNIFLLNLSVADLMMATLNALFNFVFMLKSHWPFGLVYCTISNFVSNLANGLSVFTITATSIDRYIVVMYPLRPRITKRMAAFVVFLIWFSATLLALPGLLYSRTFDIRYSDGEERILCSLHWPDGVSGFSQTEYLYNIIFFVVTYVVPMVSMAITYSLMSKVLCGSKQIGEMTEAQRLAVKSKQRVVPMLITVTVLFGVCWLPYHVYFIYTFHRKEFTEHKFVQHLYLAFYWLAMFNSFLNPVIYCLLNKSIHHSFTLFCFTYILYLLHSISCLSHKYYNRGQNNHSHLTQEIANLFWSQIAPPFQYTQLMQCILILQI
ncbi:tachykinin-like peptides receptor 86C [Leptotrombidium deliense]|uniref:Tachykinin-like peptides receptor 86C n=1 Tax=Leptotrombidium deliense TaxID=299467 RepID=A0A443ST40_9ACAR|nr:tachykinin-like peptides receptor 86C [Leptotrombidium deliense]